MKILLEPARAELSVKGSCFIAEARAARTQDEARTRVAETRAEYPDATHVVHAFVLGLSREVCGMSDDGEPSGTAGRPVLARLMASGITNIVLTVTRYFGGTLLGTGGLVRAYGDAAQKALEQCRTEEYVERTCVQFTVPYELYPDVRRMLEQFDCRKLEEKFGEQVDVRTEVPVLRVGELRERLLTLSRGKICI